MKRVKVKVIFVGDTMVGKTTILERMRSGNYNPDTIATVGASFVMLKHENIDFDIWDTAGQERYRSLTSMYFRDVKIVLFVFDVNSLKSIQSINTYKDSLQEKSDYKIIILGNKTDLSDKDINFDEITAEVRKIFDSIFLTDIIHGLYFISAKEGNNFDEFLEHLYECSLLIPLPNDNNVNNLNSNNIQMNNEEVINDKCC